MPSRAELPTQLIRFGLVGGVGFLVDVGVFNLLLASGTVSHIGGPLAAKSISVSLAILTNWIGNRLWTFRDTRRSDLMREAIEFAVVSLVGGAIALLCLAISHYALHFTSRLADNVSANVIGFALGTAFRFVGYRYWVFTRREARPSVTLIPVQDAAVVGAVAADSLDATAGD